MTVALCQGFCGSPLESGSDLRAKYLVQTAPRRLSSDFCTENLKFCTRMCIGGGWGDRLLKLGVGSQSLSYLRGGENFKGSNLSFLGRQRASSPVG